MWRLEEFCIKFDKKFANDEEKKFRFQIFKDNYKQVEKSNLKPSGI